MPPITPLRRCTNVREVHLPADTLIGATRRQRSKDGGEVCRISTRIIKIGEMRMRIDIGRVRGGTGITILGDNVGMIGIVLGGIGMMITGGLEMMEGREVVMRMITIMLRL